MFKLKKSLFAIIALIASVNAFAGNIQIELNGGEKFLHDCGGTIESTKSGAFRGGDQLNLVLRNVKMCSNFVLHETGKVYKLNGPDGDRGGSYTITAANLDLGWNTVRMTVRSNSGAHQDDVALRVKVVSGNDRDYISCYGAAKSAARNKDRDQGFSNTEAWATYLRTSNAGNYVYTVSVTGRRGTRRYEVVTSTGCAIKNVSAQ